MNKTYDTIIESPWLANISHEQTYPTLSQDIDTDVVVIGGGIAGVTAAYYLAKQGHRVVVLESRLIGHGATSNNTGHLTAHHGDVYRRYLNYYGKRRALAVLDANQTALRDIHDIISSESIACDYTPIKSYLTSQSTQGVKRLSKEADSIRQLGGKCELSIATSSTGYKSARLSLDGSMTATFHPLKYIQGLAVAATNHKVKFYEDSKATVMEHNVSGCTVHANGFRITSSKVIIATHMPILNFPGLYFMRTVAERAYSAYYPNNPTQEMIYNIDNNGLTYRPYSDGTIICGEDHRTGTGSKKAQHFATLHRQYSSQLPPYYAWSAEDVTTSDYLPFVGTYAKSLPNFYVITGFNKWGLNTAHISARLIADMISGVPNPMEEILSPRRKTPIICKLKTVGANFMTILYYIKGMFRIKSPTCTHLKCRLKFNPELETWDCPCHGSVFNKKGEVIESPALKNLKD